jgi:hypothetical protein
MIRGRALILAMTVTGTPARKPASPLDAKGGANGAAFCGW